jgi:Na+-transporting NADH:ubiquinone oxidoreductase subunit NqrB
MESDVSAEPGRDTAGSPAQRPGKFRYDRRYTAPIRITLILLAGHLSFGILEGYEKTLLAIAASFATELTLSRLFRGQWPHLASAYISGISVGILVRSPLYWPYALCSMISITSKYVLRVGERHIWNPSNFGICALLFLAPFAVAPLSVQWGNNLWPMLVIWVVGSVAIWRLRRFHICATYVAGFFLFALARSWITGDPFMAEIAPITGPMYQLFVLFMITDPKTTVKSRTGQVIVAFLVAFVEFCFRLGESVYAPFYALFLVGPAAMLVETWWEARRMKATSGTAA